MRRKFLLYLFALLLGFIFVGFTIDNFVSSNLSVSSFIPSLLGLPFLFFGGYGIHSKKRVNELPVSMKGLGIAISVLLVSLILIFGFIGYGISHMSR